MYSRLPKDPNTVTMLKRRAATTKPVIFHWRQAHRVRFSAPPPQRAKEGALKRTLWVFKLRERSEQEVVFLQVIHICPPQHDLTANTI